ncbi:hypothetical protein A5767_16895 [Rhodococcus sp. 852002-51564_SCH6189132-a]|uniref:SRPBCC domain-containing protein n=1 Tax=Rhodococcus sp. 852002-51564_SCH6189132-a TaxID=1834103 RepID=UPI0007EA0C79|nr:SRPBCC domain-containing protein [Rhodococcus sp. 852002-51564_SCH6189132-a]OBA32176.1 hypothetical protein A5767_16895 [Rhodococcus sp. 852002-51564_SCH6189132-a]
MTAGSLMATRRGRVLKWVGITLAVVFVPLAVYAAWASTKEYTLVARTEIDGTADEVWAVLTDRESYPSWNPFIVSSVGELAVDGTITNVLVGAGGGESTFTPKLLTVDPGEELRWKGTVGVPGIFDGEHYFRIEDTGNGRVVLEHGEIFSGIAVPPMMGYLRDDTYPQFVLMNEALAEQVSLRR